MGGGRSRKAYTHYSNRRRESLTSGGTIQSDAPLFIAASAFLPPSHPFTILDAKINCHAELLNNQP
ncbi:hypothetical protein TSUD_204240 [Trifolium subterraneum]|uniref:Uncharacterized protein n=1 Tax=Trifolium subterraneum TaxID=3900 RepID=A0A2Z6M3W2_TRISU|nr:hypothetical protein TSUD_204240 [Trifolium subterraneum]